MRLDQQIRHLCKEKNLIKRLEIYKTFSENNFFESIKNGRISEAIIKHLSSLLSCLLKDFIASNDESIPLLLGVVHHLYLDVEVQLTVEDHVAFDFLNKLVTTFSADKSNALSHKILSFLSIQQFPETVLNKFIEKFLQSVSIANNQSDGAIITVLNRFNKQCPETMEANIESWLKIFLHLSFHADVYIREQAVTSLKENLSVILANKKKILVTCAGYLKEVVLPGLNQLCSREDILVEILSIQLPIYMAIIGEDYRRSSRLSNSVLKFVEKGFCNSDEKIKLSAFSAWSCLLDCFSENKDLLSSRKYFHLFTQPLKLKLKSDILTKALIHVMWKLAIYLDENLLKLFEMLCVPLFGICFKGSTGVMQLRRNSSRLSHSSLQTPSESIQILGAEILSHLLLSSTVQTHAFALEPLREPYCSEPSVFARFHSTLLPAICDTVCLLHRTLPSDFLWNLWSVALNCVREISRKRDDVFKSFYNSAFRVAACGLDADLLLSIVSSLICFPSKILNSNLHYQSSDAVGDSMRGTPIISVLRLLFSPDVCRDNLPKIKFQEYSQRIIACGMERRVGKLEFICSVVHELKTTDNFFLNFWTYLCDHALVYIKNNGNVNEGDSLEHDFTTFFETLTFPFHFIFDSSSNLEEATSEAACRSWSTLFKAFDSSAVKIPNVEQNEVRQYLANRFFEKLQCANIAKYEKPRILLLENILFALVDGADLSENQCLEKTRKTKSLKKHSFSIKSFPLVSGLNSVIMEILSTLEPFFSDPCTSFPPFNILSIIHVIACSVPQSLVTVYFITCAPIILGFLRNIGMLSGSNLTLLKEVWSEYLLRLAYFDSFFENNFICELFTLALSDNNSVLYQITVDFWKKTLSTVFNPELISDEFLNVVSKMYSKEGLDIFWKENNVNSAINLNVSALSDKSCTENDVWEAVTESDTSIDDTSDVSYTNEDLDNGAHRHCDSIDGDDDITQLDRVLSDHSDLSDDCSVVNRSLNLRSLANTSICGDRLLTKEAKTSQIDVIQTNTNDNNTFLPSPITINASQEIVNIVETSSDDCIDSTNSVVIETDSDDDAICIESSNPDSISYKKANAEKFLPVPRSYCDVNESFRSTVNKTADDTFYSCETENSFVAVEMVHVSTNADLTSPLCLEEEKKCTEKKSEIHSHSPIQIHDYSVECEEDSLEVCVEMADASVMQNDETIYNKTLDEANVKEKDNDHDYVEMAEMSVYSSPLPVQDNSASFQSQAANSNEPCEDLNETEKTPMGDAQNSVTSESDSDVYEMVEMNEVSINPYCNVSQDSIDVKIKCVSDIPNSTANDFQNLTSQDQTKNPPPSPKTLKRSSPLSTCDATQAENFDTKYTVMSKSFKDKDLSYGDGLASCNELGVVPLDSSFEALTPEKLLPRVDLGSTKINDDVLESEMIKNSLPMDEETYVVSPVKKKTKRKNTTPQKSNILENTSSELNNISYTKQNCAANEESEKNPHLSSSVTSNDEDVSLTIEHDFNTLSKDITERNNNDNFIIRNKNDVIDFGDDVINKNCTVQTSLIDSGNVNVIEIADTSSTIDQNDVIEKENVSLVEDKKFELEVYPENKESPQPTERTNETVETPRSCLGKRVSSMRGECNISPSESPCGILKKRTSDHASPATKSRRVSFAEPISVSKNAADTSFRSPSSSPKPFRRQQYSNKLVSRRLSLPNISHRQPEAVSPISVRGASIAAMIADIKARNGVESSIVSSLSQKSSVNDVSSFLSKLNDVNFLESLSSAQLVKLTETIDRIAPLIHSVLIDKLTNKTS